MPTARQASPSVEAATVEPTIVLPVHSLVPQAKPVPAVIAPTHGPPKAVNVPTDSFQLTFEEPGESRLE